MRSGSHVQLAALRNRDLQLQTTSPFSNHGSVERSTACFRHKNVLVLLGFQKFPFFCVTLYNTVVFGLYVYTYLLLCNLTRWGWLFLKVLSWILISDSASTKALLLCLDCSSWHVLSGLMTCRLLLWHLFPSILGTFAKLQKATIGFVMSVRLHGTTWLPLDRFSCNLIFEDFLKICQGNSSVIKIGQE